MRNEERIRLGELVQGFLSYEVWRTLPELRDAGLGKVIASADVKVGIRHLAQRDRLSIQLRGSGRSAENEYKLLEVRDND